MSNQLFNVIFFGILQAGKDRETVMQNMAQLFKTDAKKLVPYFAGGRKIIKGKINTDAAEKYKAALENAGLVITIEAYEEIPDNAPEQPAQAGETVNTGDMSLAPVGANVVESPVDTPAQAIDDISNISMADVGANVMEHPVDAPAQHIDDISNMSLADVGTNVLDHSSEIIPQPIHDLSDFTLAEPGADMVENPRPTQKVDIPDTSELSLDEEEQKAPT